MIRLGIGKRRSRKGSEQPAEPVQPVVSPTMPQLAGAPIAALPAPMNGAVIGSMAIAANGGPHA